VWSGFWGWLTPFHCAANPSPPPLKYIRTYIFFKDFQQKIWGPGRGVVYLGVKEIKVMNMILHHLARLEMMKAEEQGIDLSYEEAIKIVENS